MLYRAKKLSEKELAELIESKLFQLSAYELKIHLYLIKSGITGELFSEELIADQLHTTEKKVISVFNEWKENGLLIETSEQHVSKEDEDLQFCLYLYGLFKGEDASLSEAADISKIQELFHINSEYFSFITEYCSKRNKLSTAYMLKIAEDWTNKGLKTKKQAEDYVNKKSEKLAAVRKAFGLNNRNLAPIEIAYIDSWKLDPEMLELACRRTLEHTGKASFRYADAIIKHWKEKNICTLQQAELEIPPSENKYGPQKPVNSFHNFEQRNYDYDELERRLLEQQTHKD